MPDRMEATALALDAYQQHLFGDLANGHRRDPAEAEGLLHSLVIDLIRYGEGNHLDTVDLLDALIQARIDRGGAITNPRYSFRIDTEVQYRNRDTDHHRGFITELTSPGPGRDTQCTLRIPGIPEPRHLATSALEPATRMVPISTRTAGTVFSAQAAEQALISMLITLNTEHKNLALDGTDPLPADLDELSTALGGWSGTTSEQVLDHLRHYADQAEDAGLDWPSAARCAAAAFPNDIAADLAREPFYAPTPNRPSPPRPGARPRIR